MLLQVLAPALKKRRGHICGLLLCIHRFLLRHTHAHTLCPSVTLSQPLPDRHKRGGATQTDTQKGHRSEQQSRCQEFAPKLGDFFTRLTDEFYVDRSAQLVLLYISIYVLHVSLDKSEGHQNDFLQELPKKCLFLTYEDPYRRQLEDKFNVKELPTVVVLRPDCSVLIPNAVDEILRLGPDCYSNWREAAELIDRNFMITEDFQGKPMRSFTDPLRRLKYKVEDEKKRNKKKRGWGAGRDDDAEADGKGVGSPW
ncbi:nucleoredoxin-like protein 1 isoform X2 [Phyllopteryx taeniolatus]|uniref:nucleoredoxin-like protein 1 isoform X2 n=1 Tax=Phyllopteryx taeniolatus TaxID=161469 RepID=UPI002AD42A11|nr:nucleoredoxin-like protein 1 isoform X2 [Phyllopteryx taeniolatus]